MVLQSYKQNGVFSFPQNPTKNQSQLAVHVEARNKNPHNQRTKAGANQTNHVRHLRRKRQIFWGAPGNYSNQDGRNQAPS